MDKLNVEKSFFLLSFLYDLLLEFLLSFKHWLLNFLWEYVWFYSVSLFLISVPFVFLSVQEIHRTLLHFPYFWRLPLFNVCVERYLAEMLCVQPIFYLQNSQHFWCAAALYLHKDDINGQGWGTVQLSGSAKSLFITFYNRSSHYPDLANKVRITTTTKIWKFINQPFTPTPVPIQHLILMHQVQRTQAAFTWR